MNTINELFRGNFKTIQEMDDFEDENVSPDRLEVLIREIENKNKLIYEYYIEAVFI